jgi:hypothetical protein
MKVNASTSPGAMVVHAAEVADVATSVCPGVGGADVDIVTGADVVFSWSAAPPVLILEPVNEVL